MFTGCKDKKYPRTPVAETGIYYLFYTYFMSLCIQCLLDILNDIIYIFDTYR